MSPLAASRISTRESSLGAREFSVGVRAVGSRSAMSIREAASGNSVHESEQRLDRRNGLIREDEERDRRKDAKRQRHHGERRQHGNLSTIDFREAYVLRFLRAKEDALHRPEHVARREDHAEACDHRQRVDLWCGRVSTLDEDRVALGGLECAEQHHYFANKSAQTGQSEICETRN